MEGIREARGWRRWLGLLAVVALAGALVACSESAAEGNGGDGSNGGDTPVSSDDRTPPGDAGSSDGSAGGDADYPTELVPAPIEDAEVLVRESFPPQYAVAITSGLPSGCAEFERIDVERDGTTFRVNVLNRMPKGDDVACTMIYGTTQNTAELGSDLDSGTEYTVDINDGEKVLTFTAQ